MYYDPNILGLNVKSMKIEEANVICPFHDDHNPSAWFNTSKGLFYCFTCGKSANAAQIAKLTGATGYLSGEDDFISYGKRFTFASSTPEEISKSSYNAKGNEYLKRRLITEKQIRYYEIEQDENGNPIFKITDLNGLAIGRITRFVNGTPKYKITGKQFPVWPAAKLDLYDPAEPVFLVEGVFGVLRANLFGIQAIATLGASKITQNVMKYLTFFKIYGIFDDDEAGRIASAKLLILSKGMCKVRVPGAEVDEWGEENWKNALEGGMWTANPNKVGLDHKILHQLYKM